MSSPTGLKQKLKQIIQHDKPDLDALDPDMNPNITDLASRDEEKLSMQVAFARNWYHEVYKQAKAGSIPWDARIDMLFPNRDWQWDNATKRRILDSFMANPDNWDLAPEELIQQGEVKVSESYHPVVEPRQSTEMHSPTGKVKNVFAKVKGMRRGRANTESESESHTESESTSGEFLSYASQALVMGVLTNVVLGSPPNMTSVLTDRNAYRI
ncbi:MAG: hypothetical protein Q9162_005546 [Coniocarpon cinnabarinum]